MPGSRPSVQHRLEYAGWHAASIMLAALPRRATVLFADFAGRLLFSVLRIRRDLVVQNLHTAFGTTHSAAQIREIALHSYQNSILTFCEFVRPKTIWWNLPEQFAPMINREHFEKVRSRTALLATGHIGNWECIPYGVIPEGIDLWALAKPLHNPLINSATLKQRQAAGLEIIWTTSSLKAIIDALRKGKWLAFLGDQDARRHGIFVDFFGKPASTATGLAFFSMKLGIPMIPIYCVRESGPMRRPQLYCGEPIFPAESADRDQEIERLTRAHVKALEEVVRAYPEHYFWLHRRWKTQPKRRGKRSAEC